MKISNATLLALLLVYLGGISIQSANALTILADPTITSASPAFNAGFPIGNALDSNTNTDYASASQGTNTFIEFDFLAPTLINEVHYTDRVTSGIPQGTCCGGNGDNVTSFALRFSQDNIFGNGDDFVQNVASAAGPTFLDVVSVNGGAGVTARFLQFDVLTAQGANVGAEDFLFFSDAPLVELNTPTVVNFSSQFNAGQFAAENIVDGVLGTNGDWAGRGAGPNFVDFDFGQSVDMEAIDFAHRNDSGSPGADNASIIELFFSDTPGVFGAIPDAVITNVVGDLALNRYGLGGEFSGRFVRLQVTREQGGGNVGGGEVVFLAGVPAIPEPTTGLLALLGSVALGARRRRRSLA